MPHYIYQTEGIIIEKKNFGEADQFISFYTSGLGGLRAVANGVRLLKSKLRYNLDNLSYAKFSFVRGKESWRIIDAKEIPGIRIKEENAKYISLGRITNLLSRLIHGEERNDNLWSVVEEGVNFLNENSFDKKSLSNFEIIMALRILDNLGYIGEVGNLDRFLKGELTVEATREIGDFKKEATLEIKKGLEESQL